MTDTNYYYSMFRSSIIWLEKYIEVAKYYSDWKQRKQTDASSILWVKEDTPKSKMLCNVGTNLMLSFEGMLDEEPLEFREELKQEFYKWLNTSQINVENALVELKCALFDFHEILECRFEKFRRDRGNRKRELEIGSPEYMKKMQEVFQKSQEAIQSGKVDQMDDSKFKGNPEEGKKTFDTIANSLTQEEKDNFHFWPQMSAEEKTNKEQQKQEPDSQTDPMLQNCRNSAIFQINSALKESKLSSSDLDFINQNWESEINQTENFIKIMDIQNRVLDDVQKKKKKLYYCLDKNPYNSFGNWNNNDYFKFNNCSNLLLPKEKWKEKIVFCFCWQQKQVVKLERVSYLVLIQ